MKKWKLVLVALFFMLFCLVVLYYSHHRSEPEIVKAVDGPVKPKLFRPVRKNAGRSNQAKKTDSAAIAARMEFSSRCIMKENFDEQAGILHQEIDRNCDGVVDRCRVKHLNTYGEPVRTENYKDCGEEPTSCYENEYNEYGEKIAYNYDTDCDGTIDKCLNFKRNDHGNVIETFFDKNCNGKVEDGEWHFCSTFEYNEDGLIKSQSEGDCGEKPAACGDFEYDLAVGMKREKWDNKCDDTVDFCWVTFPRDTPDTPDSMIDAAPDEPDSFFDEGCDGTWKYCYILGEDGVSVHNFRSHVVCAQKYEEIMKRNMEK